MLTMLLLTMLFLSISATAFQLSSHGSAPKAFATMKRSWMVTSPCPGSSLPGWMMVRCV